MTKTTKRIVDLMRYNQINQHSLEINAKLPIGSIGGWIKDKFQPSVDSIKKLACYFNVSADYLLCLTDEPRSLGTNDVVPKPPTLLKELEKLSQDPKFIDIAKMYNVLPDNKRSDVLFGIFCFVSGAGFDVKKILRR